MILVLSVATGLMAGIYFTFSVVVVKALAQLPNSDGAGAMNQINEVIVKTSFMPLFMISSIGYAGLLIWSMFYSSADNSNFIWASLIYLIGMFGITILGNVPLNNKLKNSASDPINLSNTWNDYVDTWTKLNHIRTASCIAAFVLLN